MYTCTCTYTHIHTRGYVALGTAATDKHRESPGLKNPAWANRPSRLPLVHDVLFTEAERLCKNILDNGSCDVYSSGLVHSQPQFCCSCHSLSQLRMVKFQRANIRRELPRTKKWFLESRILWQKVKKYKWDTILDGLLALSRTLEKTFT